MELKQFSYKDIKAINNGADIGLLPKFLDGTPSLTPKLPSVKPISSQGWSYNAAINTNTGGAGLKLTNPITPELTKDTNGPGLKRTPSQFFGKNLLLKEPKDFPSLSVEKFADSQRISAGISGGLSLGDAAFKAFKDYQTLDEQLAEMRTVNRKVMGIDTPMLQEAKNGKLPGFSNGLSNMLEGTGGGAMLGGSIVPGWGHVIGGLAGAAITGIGELVSEGRQNEIKKNRNNIVTSINNASHNSSVGIAQRILNLQTYGDQYSQPLHAANGKLPGCNNGNLPPYAFTEHGLVLGLKPNAMGAPGETMSDGNGNDFVLPGTPSNNDTLPIYASGKTTIVTNKKGLSKYYQQTGDLDGVQAAMAYYKQHGYKNGKMPGCAEGWLGNAIPAFLGGIAGLGQTISAYNNRPYRPNTYVGNPYEGSALTTLAGLRINPYPIMSLLRNAEARTNRAIDIAGGLSGGLRTAARLAALNTTQGNISKLLSDIQQLNNAYRANYAQAAINAGQQARTARMAANQWDLDYYSKAHAARNRGIQTGIANMLAQIQQYLANEFKRRQFNDTMQLYRDDMDQRKKNFEWMQNQSTRGIGADPATNNLTSPLQGYTPSTNLLFNLQQWDRDMKKKYPFLTYNPYRRF